MPVRAAGRGGMRPPTGPGRVRRSGAPGTASSLRSGETGPVEGGNDMICGPPQAGGREGLLHLLRNRAGTIEHGLRLLQEDLDCGSLRAGVDGICRDALGRAVLVLLSDAEDQGLPARMLQAHAFWTRNGEALERALPE